MRSKRSSETMSPQTVDEASRWFVEFRLGDADARSREAFNDWLRASPLHIRAYLEIASTDAALGPKGWMPNFDLEKLIQSARADENVVLLGSESTVDTHRDLPPQGRSTARARWVRFALAACLLVAVVTSYRWYRYDREIYATRIGEQRSLSLTDGSQLNLNAHSEVRIRFDKLERRIDLLQGQALFQVAKDTSRPFIVHVGKATIRALGTRFDVDRRASGTLVTVLEGQVGVVAGFPHSVAPPVLTEGQQLMLASDVPQIPKRADVASATAWTQRKLVFDGTPLADVIEEFNRYNTRRLVITDHSLDDVQISGIYASPDPTSLIHFLRTETDILILESPDEVRITRK